MNAYDDWPTALCCCGTSMHDLPAFGGRPSSREAHEARYHSPEFPAEYVVDPSDEDAFWFLHYAAAARTPCPVASGRDTPNDNDPRRNA